MEKYILQKRNVVDMIIAKQTLEQEELPETESFNNVKEVNSLSTNSNSKCVYAYICINKGSKET